MVSLYVVRTQERFKCLTMKWVVYSALQLMHFGNPLHVLRRKVRIHSLQHLMSHEKQGTCARVLWLKGAVQTWQSILE